MPRLTVLRFTKDYETVVDGIKKLIKDATMTEREENGHAVTDIEGNFEHFVLEDMDMWGGYLKIEIKENRARDSDDFEARAIIAQGIPELGEILFSPTIAYVYKRVEIVTKTTTITEKFVDGKQRQRDEQTVKSEPVYEWEDITREFGKKVHIS